MTGNYSARLTGSKRNLLVLLASSAVFSAGCANMTTTAPASNPLGSAATLSGRIHGGNQPVSGAAVTLWYAGQSSAATQAAATTTDVNGNFSFVKDPTNGDTTTGNTYSCPAGSSDPLVYVMAKGGNTQPSNPSQTNSAAAFIALYGLCSKLTASNFVFMSEVTTTATMAAMQQFFNPVLETFTADGTGQQKVIMTGIPNTINLLSNPATGFAASPTTLGPANAVSNHNNNINPAVTLTATPETNKLNLIANIISACINATSSAATQCTTLFSSAASPTPNVTNFNATMPTAIDTLQVLYFMFTNPTSSNTTNMNNLFALAGGVGAPYQPSLTPVPTDWTLGISYSSSSTCGTTSGGTGGFISSPKDIAIDSFNNVWIANSQTGGNLSEIASNGGPATCVNLDPGSAQSVALDSNYGVWVGAGTTMYRYSPGALANGGGLPAGTLSVPASGSPLAVTADGVGNVYFTSVAGTTGSLYQLAGASSATTAPTPLQISSTVGASPLRAIPDITKGKATLGNIWVTSGSTTIAQVAPGTGSGSLNGFITTPLTALSTGSSYGLSIDKGNDLWVSAIDTGAVNKLAYNSGSSSWATAGGWPYTATTAGIASPTAISTDPRGNTWIPNNTNGASTGSVSEISNAPNPLSPATGFQKAATYFNSGRVAAIDQAGNVWIAGDGNSFVTEIVGESVPIYTPYAVGLLNGRFQNVP